MKRLIILILSAALLCGCTGSHDELEKAMTLRAGLLASAVSFDAQIMADYGDKRFTFSMNCQSDASGDMTFTVSEPESIAGISGTISSSGGKLTFTDTALAFSTMADGLISPVSAPWVLMKTLRSGYLTAASSEDGKIRLAIDDSYEENALHLDIWLDEENFPSFAEIYWQGRRLLSVTVSNFCYV